MNLAKGSKPWLYTQACIALISSIPVLFLSDVLQSIIVFVCCMLWLLFVVLLIFFRDPKRTINKGIVAAADGYIQSITTVDDEECGVCYQIKTFMNIYDVHVNRACIQGTIKNITHIPGSHLPAFRKDSWRNERVITLIDSPIGMIKIIQIAGTLARRIVPYVAEGDILRTGDKIGLIRLGSRVDVYLPQKHIQLQVRQGMRIKAGESCIATITM